MDFILKSKSVMVLMLFIAAWALSIYIATLTPGLQHIGKSLIIQPELFDGSKMLFGILAVVFILFVLTLYSAQSALGIKTVALPALIYSVTTARLLPNVGFNDTLVAAICCALLLYVANLSVIKQKDNSPIFLFGFICVLMLMFAPKLVLIVPASLLILAFIGRFSLKDISALFIGWVAALILILTYLFAKGNLTQFIGAWQDALFYRTNGGFEYVGEWIRLALSLLILFIVIVITAGKYMPQVYTARRVLSVEITMILTMVLSVVLWGGIGYDFHYIVALPIAHIMAYFVSCSNKRFAYVLLATYLLLSVWPIF